MDITEVKIDLSKIWTIEQMKRAYKDATGGHFFDPETMRFFKSRIAPGIVHTEHGITFITSEQFVTYYPSYYKDPRKYTLRMLKENGDIVELSEFQAFNTLRQARTNQNKYTEFVARLP